MKIRVFDATVVGDSVGGLLAALLLQKRHSKVAVIRKRSSIHATPYFCEFLNGFALKSAMKRVGFHPTEVNSIPSLDSPIQLVFPNRRIDCYGDEQRFERELIREFPKEAKQILQLFRNGSGHLEIYQHIFNSRVPLPPKGFFANQQFKKILSQVCDPKLLESHKLAKELKSYDVGEDFTQAIEAMQLCFTQLKTDWTCGAQLGHLLGLSRWDGYWAPEGMVTIQNLLLDKIREKGGVLVDADEFKEIHYKGKNISGFELGNAEFSEVTSQVVIVAGDPRGLIAIDPENKKMQNWQKELNELPAVLQKVYQTIRLAPEGLPIGMKVQGIIIPKSNPPGAADRRSHVRAIRYVVRQQAKPNGAIETVMGLCAFIQAEGPIPNQDTLKKEIRDALRWIVPFLDSHLIEEPSNLFIPTQERKAGDFWQSYIYASDKPRELGVVGFSPETPFANTFVAGDTIFPGLGLDGEIIGAMQAGYYAGEIIGKDRVLGD